MTRGAIIAVFALLLVLAGASVVSAQGTGVIPGSMMQNFDAGQMQQVHDQMIQQQGSETREQMQKMHEAMTANGGPGGMMGGGGPGAMMQNVDPETWQKMQDAMKNGDFSQMRSICHSQATQNGGTADGNGATTQSGTSTTQNPPASAPAGRGTGRSRMM